MNIFNHLPCLLYCGAMLLCSTLLMAQGTTFGEQQIIQSTTLNNPNASYTADLDNDGNNDVIAISGISQKIVWYKNKGNGEFGEQQIIASDSYIAMAAHIADLDHDGDNDVISAFVGYGKINWYRNDGIGNFDVQEIETSDYNGMINVYAADLDNDGDTDLLSSHNSNSNSNQQLIWYANNGNGVFTIAPIIDQLSGFYTASIYAADLDNDSHKDILTISASDGAIIWYKNNGSGNFGAKQTITTLALFTRKIDVADLDNDGDNDVIVSGDYSIYWYRNDGTGNFAEQQMIASNPIHDAYIADCNNDGNIDIIYASVSGIYWHQNDGAGNFATQQIISTNNSNNPTFIYLANFDHDNNIDILLTNSAENSIVWYQNNGDLNFDEAKIIVGNITNDTVICTADLDNDGDKEVLSASYSDGKIAYYDNKGSGDFATQQIIATDAVYVMAFFAVDLDNDSDSDILLATQEGRIVWYENNGNCDFGEQQIIWSNSLYFLKTIYSADLDNNGYNDVIATLDNSLVWFANNGNGLFFMHQAIATDASNIVSISVADLNQDGDKDIVFASATDAKIAWYENEGNGNFGPQNYVSLSAINVNAIFTADMDNDGDIEILSTYIASDKMSWFANNGNNIFLEQTPIVTAYNDLDVPHVYIADLDNDGDKDILSAFLIGQIVWYENEGNGNFSAEQIITDNASGARYVYAADLDNDSDIDALSVSMVASKIAWYENQLLQVGLAAQPTSTPSIEAYPNPTKDLFYLKQAIATPAHYALYTITGAEVLQGNFDTLEQSISVAHLASGLYYLNINGQCTRLLKE